MHAIALPLQLLCMLAIALSLAKIMHARHCPPPCNDYACIQPSVKTYLIPPTLRATRLLICLDNRLVNILDLGAYREICHSGKTVFRLILDNIYNLISPLAFKSNTIQHPQ